MTLERFKKLNKEEIKLIGEFLPEGFTYDKNGNQLTRKDDDGYWNERTYNKNNNELTYKTSDGYWREYIRDDKENRLTYIDSDGWWWEKICDDEGNQLTYKNNDGYYEIRDKKVTKEEFEAFINKKQDIKVYINGELIDADSVEIKIKENK